MAEYPYYYQHLVRGWSLCNTLRPTL